MDGKRSPKNSMHTTPSVSPSESRPIHRHGLRLIKGFAPQSAQYTAPETNPAPAPTGAKKNRLVLQLGALADSIDRDVNLILKL